MLTLFFAEICHVRRRLPFWFFSLLSAGREGSGVYAWPVGVRLKKMPASVCSVFCARTDPQNHNLSLTSGPPTAGSMSHASFTVADEVSPRAARPELRLLLCRLWLVNEPMTRPLNVFPPSRGTRLIFT